jgi:hypothetical protein
MEQKPSWEANRFSASQEIPRVLWNNPKVHHRIHKISHPVPILRQIKQIYACHPTLRCSIFKFMPSTPWFYKWSLHLGFPTKTLSATFLSPYMLRAPPISFLIWSPHWWLVMSTDHKAPLNLSSSIILWYAINPLNAQLNPIFHLLALLGAHHILHVSRIRVNALYQLRVSAPRCNLHGVVITIFNPTCISVFCSSL